jgi:alpha-ketoglutarate-dependent taurine dioxygenase
VERSPETPSPHVSGEEIASIFQESRCIFFRGFEATIEQFEQLTSSFTENFMSYQGGGFTIGPFSRSTINDNKTLLTATGKTQEFPLPLHGEMYYLSRPPDLIWFYCATPVQQGGETTVGDGAAIFRDLPDETQSLFRQRRIRYERHLSDGDWQLAYQTDDRSAIELFCRTNELDLTWASDGSAVTCYRCSALRTDVHGNTCFINDLLLLALAESAILSGDAAAAVPEAANLKPDFVVRWEDGSRIDHAILKQIGTACGRNEVPIAWQQGDILMVDNRSILHGRRKSSGRDRKILVRMGSLKGKAVAV